MVTSHSITVKSCNLTTAASTIRIKLFLRVPNQRRLAPVRPEAVFFCLISHQVTSSGRALKMPRKVRFADEKPQSCNTSKLTDQPSSGFQQQEQAMNRFVEECPLMIEDNASVPLTGAVQAEQRAQEAKMRARMIQNNVRHRNEMFCSETKHKENNNPKNLNLAQSQSGDRLRSIEITRPAQASSKMRDNTNILSMSMVWISDVIHGIQSHQ